MAVGFSAVFVTRALKNQVCSHECECGFRESNGHCVAVWFGSVFVAVVDVERETRQWR